jgi:hypothetical protein
VISLAGDVVWRASRRRDCEALVDYARSPQPEKLAAIHASTVADLAAGGSTPHRIYVALLPGGDPYAGTDCPVWLARVLASEDNDRAGKQWRELSDAYLAAHEKALADAEAGRVAAVREREEASAREARERAEQAVVVMARNARLGVDRQIEETREHGEIDVRQAESTALGSDLVWHDHPSAVRWTDWVADLCELTDKQRSQFPDVLADARDTASPNHAKHRNVIALLWERACERATELPALLDLSGVPAQHGWFTSGTTHLTDLVKRCSQGATILVAHPVQSWALARVLPPTVGART